MISQSSRWLRQSSKVLSSSHAARYTSQRALGSHRPGGAGKLYMSAPPWMKKVLPAVAVASFEMSWNSVRFPMRRLPPARKTAPP
eukprot:5979957-Prymnesium_polylepis.1